MKKYFKLFFLFILLSCTSNKEVFWCGDHACVNKTEKEEYFKKNMIIEIRQINVKDNQKNSKFNEVIRQGKLQKEEFFNNQNQKQKKKII